MISALSWVRQGAAAATPEKLQLTEEEFIKMQEKMGQHLQLAKDDLEDAENEDKANGNSVEEQDSNDKPMEDDDELAIYNLDTYDEEEPSNQFGAPMFSNIKGLSYYSNNKEDPYIELDDALDDQEELDEMHIEPTDNLILACKTEDDISHLEVYLYEPEEDNLYVHHDILLPSFPLAIEWLDFPVGRKSDTHTKGNYVAIGTFDPQVEIWDLDTVDSMFPDCILGQIPDASLGTTSKKSKFGPARVAKRPQAERHVDAVMSISWNTVQRNLILTGSADTTVKLWDLTRPNSAVTSFNHHKDKVQAVVWNKFEPSVLVSGGYDKRVCAFDSRASNTVAEWKLTADVECIKWDTFHQERFYVSTEDGIVKCFDVRNPKSKALFTLHAHDSAVSALDVNPHIPGCLVTGSADKQVKVWSLQDTKPKCLVSRDLDAGKVFSTTFSPDSPYILAIGGSKGKVVLWNLEDNNAVRKQFPPNQLDHTTKVRSKPAKEILQVDSDNDPNSDEDEEFEDEIMEGDYSEEENMEHV
ncbi:WD40-repeat-containing domain protein [Globomyces pollinis-pini]|nr:WD40-repeat-containing domain protein [Globomyces pollinis-pini]